MNLTHLKYFLLFIGVLLPFLNGIFETEKEEGLDKTKHLKKLTKSGRLLLVGGLLFGLFGIFQTYKDDSTSEEQKRNAKIEYETNRKIDSLNYSKKYSTDSMNFANIIFKLRESNIRSDSNRNKIIDNAINLSNVALTSVNEAKFPIPNRFVINLEAELDLPTEIGNVQDKILKIYNFNFDDKAVQGFALDDEYKNFFNDDLLFMLHNFKNSSIDYEISFFKKDDLVLTISDLNKTNLSNYKTKNYRNIAVGLRNEIRIFYYPRINKFKLSFSQVETEAKNQMNASSLLNLKNCTIKIRFYGSIFTQSGKHLDLKLKRIEKVSIATPANLFIGFENLSTIDNFGKIVTINSKNDWK